ncbi:hypothetical protein CQW32_07670 [Pseudomonas putida]|jgi:hypothetical protein|uniref:hypothetical protein n=1 Tax=Pseudomonas putida TaxID=303 RepID=UPI000C2A87D7|nr:hypothetical protein [Pseudomonas putida]PJX10895.1 hypothetical protein CQW32_07670 [Pseudomonas putida]
MRIRGDVFWDWADPVHHHRSHGEKLDDGTSIDVQVRLSRVGQTQMFIGIYAGCGVARHEEAFDSRPGESMTRALAWGVERARCLAIDQQPAVRQVA